MVIAERSAAAVGALATAVLFPQHHQLVITQVIVVGICADSRSINSRLISDCSCVLVCACVFVCEIVALREWLRLAFSQSV